MSFQSSPDIVGEDALLDDEVDDAGRAMGTTEADFASSEPNDHSEPASPNEFHSWAECQRRQTHRSIDQGNLLWSSWKICAAVQTELEATRDAYLQEAVCLRNAVQQGIAFSPELLVEAKEAGKDASTRVHEEAAKKHKEREQQHRAAEDSLRAKLQQAILSEQERRRSGKQLREESAALEQCSLWLQKLSKGVKEAFVSKKDAEARELEAAVDAARAQLRGMRAQLPYLTGKRDCPIDTEQASKRRSASSGVAPTRFTVDGGQAAAFTRVDAASPEPICDPPHSPLPSLASVLQRVRTSNKWSSNSCAFDSILTLWECMQRWLLVLREADCAQPQLVLPQCLTRHVGIDEQFMLTSDLGTALRLWWEQRYALIDADAPLSNEQLIQARTDLMCARDAVRQHFECAYCESDAVNTAATKEELEIGLAEACTIFRSAGTLLHHLLIDRDGAFVKHHMGQVCSQCDHTFNCPVPDKILNVIELQATVLEAHGGDTFAALTALLRSNKRTGRMKQCPVCCSETESQYRSSNSFCPTRPIPAGFPEVPPFLLSRLPDLQPDNLEYNIRPSEIHQLEFPERMAEYKLVGIVLYSGGHYICDVLFPDEDVWLRFDGIDDSLGVGQPVVPSAGCVDHNGTEYYPYILLYALTKSRTQPLPHMTRTKPSSSSSPSATDSGRCSLPGKSQADQRNGNGPTRQRATSPFLARAVEAAEDVVALAGAAQAQKPAECVAAARGEPLPPPSTFDSHRDQHQALGLWQTLVRAVAANAAPAAQAAAAVQQPVAAPAHSGNGRGERGGNGGGVAAPGGASMEISREFVKEVARGGNRGGAAAQAQKPPLVKKQRTQPTAGMAATAQAASATSSSQSRSTGSRHCAAARANMSKCAACNLSLDGAEVVSHYICGYGHKDCGRYCGMPLHSCRGICSDVAAERGVKCQSTLRYAYDDETATHTWACGRCDASRE